jgi:hypothetical protein
MAKDGSEASLDDAGKPRSARRICDFAQRLVGLIDAFDQRTIDALELEDGTQAKRSPSGLTASLRRWRSGFAPALSVVPASCSSKFQPVVAGASI